MNADPYYWTQDNGAGGPIHFSTTYKQLDMVHHILNNCPEAVNQPDHRGFTPLHRAAYLAQYDGYLEIYEYLLSRGADPTIRTKDYDPYLNPGRKTPVQIAIEDDNVRGAIRALEEKYAHVKKTPEPHPDLSDWWTVYDYGFENVRKWPKDYKPKYPEERRRERLWKEKMEFKETRRKAREAAIAAEIASGAAHEMASKLTIKPALDIASNPADADASSSSSSVKPPAASSTGGGEPKPSAEYAPPTAPASKDDNDTSPVAFLFPGQGSQAVGMLRSVADVPAVKEMCDKAKEILGYDLLDVCVNGPKEKLDATEFAQPALFVAGLAAVEKLRIDSPAVVDSCASCAGLSLGEYTALVFAGAMTFEEGLRVVKVRAESMAAAAKVGDHGMLSVVGLKDDALEECVVDAKKACGDGVVCEIANKLFPTGRVVSGDKRALDEVTKLATDKGAMKCAMLAVSGAFHTERMESARAALVEALNDVNFQPTRMPVYSNVSGAPFYSHNIIPSLLAEQLVQPVLWEDTVRAMIAAGKTEMYELGPKAQIKSMAKRIDAEVWKKFKNVDVSV